MKKPACFVLSIIIIMLLAGGRTALATSSGLYLPDRQVVQNAIADQEAMFGPLTLAEGEVIAVDDDCLQLVTGSGLGVTYQIPTSCAVYINGRLGSLSALRPVASGSFFAVRLYLDQEQTPRLIDGWYVGGLATIMAVDSRAHTLCVQAIESNEVFHLAVVPELREEISRMTRGKVCFLLLGWEAQVRKIYYDR
ncbi:MAG: hypothetical protein GX050_10650 [Firmicutes bacterium]|nr:hypothetical protein [Bacillota bacterium]